LKLEGKNLKHSYEEKGEGRRQPERKGPALATKEREGKMPEKKTQESTPAPTFSTARGGGERKNSIPHKREEGKGTAAIIRKEGKEGTTGQS